MSSSMKLRSVHWEVLAPDRAEKSVFSRRSTVGQNLDVTGLHVENVKVRVVMGLHFESVRLRASRVYACLRSGSTFVYSKSGSCTPLWGLLCMSPPPPRGCGRGALIAGIVSGGMS
jgi:hypothetical protein